MLKYLAMMFGATALGLLPADPAAPGPQVVFEVQGLT